jgi:hypothetical protein
MAMRQEAVTHLAAGCARQIDQQAEKDLGCQGCWKSTRSKSHVDFDA